MVIGREGEIGIGEGAREGSKRGDRIISLPLHHHAKHLIGTKIVDVCALCVIFSSVHGTENIGQKFRRVFFRILVHGIRGL